MDTLKYAERIKTKAEFTDAQAVAVVTTFSEIIAMSYGNLATKEDIRTAIADANAKLAEINAKLDTKLTTEISNVRDTLSRWMFGLIITLVITLVTVLTKLR